MFDEQRGHLSRGVRNRRKSQSALADLIERREGGVVANFHWAILPGPAHDDSGGKPGVLQLSLAHKGRPLPGTWRLREQRRDQSSRLGKFSLPVPAPQPVNLVAADLHVHVLQFQKIGDGANFILRRKDYRRFANRCWEAEFFRLAETFAVPEAAVAYDAGKGNGLIEQNFGRPLRKGMRP